MQGELLATVIICTRDRAVSLARTLDSLVRSARGVEASWELLIVDNGSSDDTPETVERFRDVLPVRRIFEPKAGLSNARNAGVQASRGRYIIWTDDDVIVDEGWLASYLKAFLAHPDAALFGGRAVPLFEEPVQDWFVANTYALWPLLAIRDNPGWREITWDRTPYGLNYAVRGVEQRASPYDPELGVAPGRRQGGEELAVIRKILQEGGTGVWVWEATVLHVIPAQRQTEAYIREYYRTNGNFPSMRERSGFFSKLKGAARLSLRLFYFFTKYHIYSCFRRSKRIAALVAFLQAQRAVRIYFGMKPY